MRTGLLLSRDGGAITQTVDVEALCRDFSHLAVAKVYDTFFSAAAQRDILNTVIQGELDSVVLAGNSPKYYERVPSGTQVLDAIAGAGINANNIAFANLKEQVALPHLGQREQATVKARGLLRAALAKVELTHPVKTVSVAPRRAVLIVGATEGGVLAARALLGKEYRVHLVEKGAGVRASQALEQPLLPTVAAIESHAKMRLHFESVITDVSGWCGEYTVVLATPEGEQELSVGGIILAAGGDTELISELRPKLQLDTDDAGQIVDGGASGLLGRTEDPGVWSIPPSRGDDLGQAAAWASGVVLSLTTLLDKNELDHPVLVSEIDENVCGGCGTCVKTCAFAASSIDIRLKLSSIDVRRCKGCGNCVVACPTGARDLVTFPEAHIIRSIGLLSEAAPQQDEPRVLVLLCNGCGYPAADRAGELAAKDRALAYSPNVMPLRVECGGNVDTQYVLEAFKDGFDGVAVTVCRDGHCHHVVGNTDMERRLGLFREVLRSRNIDAERLRVIHVSPHEGKLFSQEIQEFCEALKAAGSAAVA